MFMILKKEVKTDLKNIKKLNFQPPSATFFRENILEKIYRKMMSLFVAPKGGNQCRVNPGNGVLSLTEFLSRNECNDSRKSLLFFVFTPVSKMLA